MEIRGNEIFEKLMPFRIKNILIVASLYDSFMFIDDDIFLDTLGFGYYARDNIGIEKAKNIDDALKILEKNKFDLIILVIQSAEFDMDSFVKTVKVDYSTPLVILSFSLQDINLLSDEVKKKIDYLFLWQGDTRIFSSIINLVEDKINLKHDLSFGVQCVMLVEDNIRFYSMYLPIIYNEMIKQMQIVMADDMSSSRKLLRMRARPKIVLFNNYYDAWNFFEHYHNNLLGVITDVEYPGGNSQEKAGLLLARKIKEKIPDMPVLVQSSNQIYEKKALSIGSSFLNKNSSDLSKQLRNFITRYFGFGDFVFDDGTGKEIARAYDLQSMIKVLKVIPEKSLLYHASRNHFSKWLLARTEFEIAYKIKPKKIEEFSNTSEIRNYLIETIHQFMYRTHLGAIVKFDRNRYSSDIPFAKIGNGSVGGKARGLAFLNYLLGKDMIPDEMYGIKVKTPNSVVIASDVFDFFIEHNNLDSFISGDYSEIELSKIFENVNLPDYALRDIVSLVEKIKGPIAVRSSSILEDSKNYPFAGIYKTFMIPKVEKLSEMVSLIEKAIKLIYASIYSAEAKEFRKMNPLIPDEEKMSIIIQEVVGREYIKGYYFPLLSGVIQSCNFYPIHPLKSEDPIIHIAAGLGEVVVSGKYFMRYSPLYPNIIHQLSNNSEIVKNSQKKIIGISLDKQTSLSYFGCSSIKEIDVESIEPSPEMKLLYSTYFIDDDKIVDGYIKNGIPLLTIFPIIRSENFFLNKVFVDIVNRITDYMGSNVEIEFAFDMDCSNSYMSLYLLQVRNLVSKFYSKKYNIDYKNSKKIVESNKAVGNSFINDIIDIVYVKEDSFNNMETFDIAKEISEINSICKKENRRYILIGPGRWGSSDRYLGIPVKWNDISMSKTIIEVAFKNFNVEPSYGTHFFHNIVAMNIPYFSVDVDGINWKEINSMVKVLEKKYIKWVRSNYNLVVLVQDGKGFIFVEI
ncbi:MAG: hypothetical protein N2446_03080 [Elusimicrobiales bacterium]|nr:hypothetical protein [Elusimicrobiales bacterium]